MTTLAVLLPGLAALACTVLYHGIHLHFIRGFPICGDDEQHSVTAGDLSVIIPARNEEDHLGPCLGSLLVQTHSPHEIIVVDDGSKDATAWIAKQLSPRVKTISVAGPEVAWAGKSYACHRGFAACSGEYVLFTDADTVGSAG